MEAAAAWGQAACWCCDKLTRTCCDLLWRRRPCGCKRAYGSGSCMGTGRMLVLR